MSDPGASAAWVSGIAERLVEHVEQVVKGRHEAVELVVVGLLSGGHVLIEDVPGTGKTTLARALARSLDGGFARIQATADLLPSDITGNAVWNPGEQRFSFLPGPVFTNVLLVDELNRTPPRTQSAFLEVMEEGAVTVDGVSHPVPDPFFVIATQNPVEQHGAYPLPEGQLDRFSLRVHFHDLAASDELAVIREQLVRPTVLELGPVVDIAELRTARAAVREVHVSEAVLEHGLAVVRATREDRRIRLGASPRAAITLARCAQALAVLRGRDFVTPDDVRDLAAPVLAHRLVPADLLQPPGAVVRELAARVPVPVGR